MTNDDLDARPEEISFSINDKLFTEGVVDVSVAIKAAKTYAKEQVTAFAEAVKKVTDECRNYAGSKEVNSARWDVCKQVDEVLKRYTRPDHE